MRNFLRRLFRHEKVFIIANTAFWLGLAALLLTDPLRLAVGGSLLALALGGYLLYGGLSPKIARGTAQPENARILATVFGLVAIVAAVLMLAHALSGGVESRAQSRRRAMERELAQAASGGTWLTLSNLGLREIPPQVWEFAHLTQLDLNGNRIKVLPPDIARLANLERLSLDGNRLEALPPEIGQLSHLAWLDLDNNRLTTLPPEFARLQALTHLQIQYNRWKTFPDVILELPNLELLFLAGNQLGDLPPSITQRAEAGELELWYKPNASRIDWSSIIVIGFCFVLPVLLSAVVDRWWMCREQAQQRAAQETGEVFAIPPMQRSPTLFVIFALSAISLLMLIAALNGPQTGITMQAGVGISLLFAPLIIGGLIFLLHNTGMVTLTAAGVTIRRAGRARFLRYADIVAVTSQPRIFGPAIVIRGHEGVLRIPRTLEKLPRFYTLLLQRVSPAVRDVALGKITPAPATAAPAASTADNGPVYAFAISRRVWALYIAGTVLLVLIYLGIGLLGIWSGLARGVIPPFNTPWVRNSLIFFLMISVVFLPALIIVIRALTTKYGPFKMEQPVAWEFYGERIRYRFPRGGWEERSAGALQSITLKPMLTRVRGGRGIETTVTLYVLVLEFADASPLVIDQERAVQFGQTPERLHTLIGDLYGCRA